MLPEVATATSRTMRANRGRDTGPELALRSALHARGLRFRVNQPLPFNRRRRSDLTFTKVALYVFVDGCFWHGCPEHFIMPKTRRDFWLDKIRDNQARDVETSARLEALGGTVVRVWEHEGLEAAADTIETVYRDLMCRSAAGTGLTGRAPAGRRWT